MAWTFYALNFYCKLSQEIWICKNVLRNIASYKEMRNELNRARKITREPVFICEHKPTIWICVKYKQDQKWHFLLNLENKWYFFSFEFIVSQIGEGVGISTILRIQWYSVEVKNLLSALENFPVLLVFFLIYREILM